MTDLEHKTAIMAAVRALNEAMYLASRDGLRAEIRIQSLPGEFGRQGECPKVNAVVLRVL